MPVYNISDALNKGIISQDAYNMSQKIGKTTVDIPDDPYANWYTAQAAGISREDYLAHLKAGVEQRSGMDFESYMTQVRANSHVIPENVMYETMQSYAGSGGGVSNAFRTQTSTCSTSKCSVTTASTPSATVKQPNIETYPTTIELTNKITDPNVIAPQTFVTEPSVMPSNKFGWMPLVLLGGALVGFGLLFTGGDKKESPVKTYET